MLITKPGYGSFVEAASASVPVLYVSRGDWPEQPCILDWMNAYGRCLELDRAALDEGRLDEPVARLLALPEKPAPVLTGVNDALRAIHALLT